MIHTVGVVVPAANEQAHIGECLNALIHAREYAQTNATDRLEVRIIVVLDSCVDGTASIVNQHPGIEATQCSAGCVGSARALGVQHLLDTCSTARRKIWLANTDADSRVPANWITSMLMYAERGAHLVLGTVTPDDGLDLHRRHAWRARHHLRNGHPHIHGANFGIRADTCESCAPRRSPSRPVHAWPHARPTGSPAVCARCPRTQPPGDDTGPGIRRGGAQHRLGTGWSA